VKITIIGGGPSGLYCGLLLKKAGPRNDITILERNPPDAIYGWGVVFSERTLGAFREADAETAATIAERFVLWDVIDVRYRGQVIRCGGQPIGAISRKMLLNILRRRCEELGVTMRFGEDVTSLSALPAADILIGADGISSIVRRSHAAAFRPSMEEGTTKYVWYGTDRRLNSFMFIFRESEHGPFHAHTYPFDTITNTFIVECPEPVCRQAGLDQADEAQSLAYCERLFAPELDGGRLLSNNSRWVNFVTLKTERWYHRNIVLLGDAAHTAHFSIGSGTKLAMEDAIALAGSIERHPNIEVAFHEYEVARQPIVEAFQQAARGSQKYFEQLHRYLHLDPLQFAFRLITRGGRMSFAARALGNREIHAEVDQPQ
jgi:anthraniloyl-CoA monooxygenase